MRHSRRIAALIAKGLTVFEGWERLAQERRRFDTLIQDWANGLDASWLEGDLTSYSTSAGRELTSPRALLVMHFFNHQTHHPGQVHTQLTDFGIKSGITDLRFGTDLCAS